MVSKKNVPILEPSCLSRYRRVMGLVKNCAKVCGADVFEPGFRYNWITYTLLTLLHIFYCSAVYTIYTKVQSDGNYNILLEATCFVSAAVQSHVKLICYTAQQLRVREVQTFLDGAFMKYETRGVNYQDELLKSITLTTRAMKMFGFIYILCFITVSGFPMVYNALHEDKALIMQFLLPGLDPNTNIGYWLLTSVHISLLGMGAFGNFASDMYLLVMVGSGPLLKNILRCKFEDLNEMMNHETQPTRHQVQEAMVDIVLWHKEYLKLLSNIEQIFFTIILVHVFCCVASIISALYCMVMGFFPAAPFFAALFTANLYLYCGLGTVIDMSNDDCSEIIYTESCWFNLPISEQRIVLLMLRKSQATESISVGNMMPLTVGTALQLTKATYTIIMLLMSNRE